MSTPGGYWKPPERSSSPLPPGINPHPSAIPVTRTPSAQTSKDVSSSPHKPSTLAASTEQRVAPESSLKMCEACETPKQQIWNCSYCGVNFCDDCWDKQLPHKPGRTGPDGLPHEKGDETIVKRLINILTPPADADEQQQLHIEDEDTTWFGIAREEGNSIFQDYGRYANIMADSTTGAHKLRYPQLVSFIGQTGAGKSTLVKMLIDQEERRSNQSSGLFASPVVGSIRTENVPTSGDVHLYGDPRSYYSESPLLYADCEGLEGGENMPMSAQYTDSSSASKDKKKDRRHTFYNDHRKRHKVTKVARGASRNLIWASTPETSKRQYAVTELYPRLLYTFSDVIVFVLQNPK